MLVKNNLLLLLVLMFGLTVSMNAATYSVTKTADTNDGLCDADCSLREAVAAANGTAANDVIKFVIPPNDAGCSGKICTITLMSGQISIASTAAAGSLTIENTDTNADTADNLRVSGNNVSRVFQVSNTANLTLNNFSVINGFTGGTSQPGAGIALVGGSLTLLDMIIRNNRAGFAPGGGIDCGNASPSCNLIINNSTISDNWAQNSGGGIHVNGVGGATLTVQITNSTFSNNTSNTGNGGGFIENGTTGSSTVVNIVNSTFSNNFAGNRGGGVAVNTGTTSLRNTIIAGNSGLGNPDILKNTTVTVNSAGNNLVTNSSDTFSPITWQTAVGIADILNQAPRLAPLGYYGGKTFTRPLLNTSPALNAGNNCVINLTCATNNPPTALATDQRGAGRVGNLDIGAFELNNTANGGTFRAALSTGTQNLSYNFVITPNNGAFTYTVSSGALPNGVSLTTNLAPNAVVALTGTPTQDGIFDFTITASDGTNTNVTNYRLQVLVPTAAGVSVSGRVTAADGRGVRNAIVVLTLQNGETVQTRSSTFGYFRFDDIEVGQTVVVSVISKRFQFAPQIVSATENIDDLNLVALNQ